MTLHVPLPWLVAGLAIGLVVLMALRRPEAAGAVFDLVLGDLLDKEMLKDQKVRVASARRKVAYALVIWIYWTTNPANARTWQSVVLWGIATWNLDIGKAILAAPAAAMKAIGEGVGAAAGGARRGYQSALYYGRSAFAPVPDAPGEDNGPGPQSPDGAVG